MDINSTNSNVDIEQDNVDVELSSDIPQISLETKSSINIEVPEKKEFNIETPKIETNKNHANMENLDYENSGHTGFASSKDIENIDYSNITMKRVLGRWSIVGKLGATETFNKDFQSRLACPVNGKERG